MEFMCHFKSVTIIMSQPLTIRMLNIGLQMFCFWKVYNYIVNRIATIPSKQFTNVMPRVDVQL